MNQQHDNSAKPSAAGEAPLDSIRQRRAALRSIGRASALLGAASPLAAMATGKSGRPWCYKDTSRTTCVHASISGIGSVLHSAQANGNQHYGHGCSYYQTYGNAGACKDKKFKQIFNCSSASTDSRGEPPRKSGANNPDCLFNMKPHQVCTSASDSPEAHWFTAYCNALKLHRADVASSQFPYHPNTVVAHYSDGRIVASAYLFYKNHMEHGLM